MLRRPASQPKRSLLPSNLVIRKNSSSSPLKRLLQNQELDHESATDELRWMQEAVAAKNISQEAKEDLLQEMVQLRAGGKPLQYILGVSFCSDNRMRLMTAGHRRYRVWPHSVAV